MIHATDEEVIRETASEIFNSLTTVLLNEPLTDGKTLKNAAGLKKHLENKLRGKLTDLKDPTKVMRTIAEMQEDAFNDFLENLWYFFAFPIFQETKTFPKISFISQ